MLEADAGRRTDLYAKGVLCGSLHRPGAARGEEFVEAAAAADPFALEDLNKLFGWIEELHFRCVMPEHGQDRRIMRASEEHVRTAAKRIKYPFSLCVKATRRDVAALNERR